jgi:hypothetical protein
MIDRGMLTAFGSARKESKRRSLRGQSCQT